MKQVSLSGSPRESVGKQDAKKIRREGKVPVVVYGDEKQVFGQVDHITLEKIVISPDVYQIDFQLEGQSYPTIIQELQFHPVTDKILHVDLLMVDEKKPVKVALPIRLTGNAIGVRNGGRLLQTLRKITVKAIANDIPDFIEVNIDKLRIGQAIRVKDLNYPKLTFLQSENSVVVAIKTARGAVDADDDTEEEGGEEAAATEAAAEAPANAEAAAE
jgi:large subunit ribosomal protein L25